ncbi:unnamed protein product [Miscanthus lutarioriparius]|uniref:Glycerol-3-phosphate acyltransferase RAM2/GPAT1-8 HAD-like domain-containing protein n=1 Tax=Miscanthus lutarioriparius TaxID=422564 RepID=A0A811RTK7_9POAL|nr:unnamed protein product [Miscanthus lutarioriparius]
MALTSDRFMSRALRIHRLVKRGLAAGLRRCSRGAATTAVQTAASPSPPALRQQGENAFAVDADALLLNPSPGAAFPPYFLAAVEAGGYARGLVLLALYPVLRALPCGARVRAMAMVSFCGLRRDEAARVGRAVLPKIFSREAPGVHAVEPALRALPKEAKVVAVSPTFPTVMVEAFLKEYVGFDAVAGRELKGGPRYLTGAMAELDTERVARSLDQTEKTTSCGYAPKPVVFHDGRLAFTPTAAAALAMYIYFPFGVVLAVIRIAIYILLPWRVSAVAAALTGVRVLSPIPLRRLTRDREVDRRRMSSMLARGDVIVCPEGTTCREPYLLRFSPLFAELAAEVTPEAVDARTSEFYATSTSPLAKSLDSVYFLMNPRPEYSVQFLKPVSTEGGKSSIEVANEVQRELASALGFQGTTLTRKDKYLLLSGNEGLLRSS